MDTFKRLVSVGRSFAARYGVQGLALLAVVALTALPGVMTHAQSATAEPITSASITSGVYSSWNATPVLAAVIIVATGFGFAMYLFRGILRGVKR